MIKESVIQEAINQLLDKDMSDKEIIYALSHKYKVRKLDIECILLGVDKVGKRYSDRPEGWLLRKEV